MVVGKVRLANHVSVEIAILRDESPRILTYRTSASPRAVRVVRRKLSTHSLAKVRSSRSNVT